MQLRISRDVYGSPVTKPTWWWQMTIIPHWDYHDNLQSTTIHGLRMNSFLKVCGITFQFNAIAALIVSGILAISRRVRSLTQRLKGYTIEYQHRYRRSRKSSTGCGGLRALYVLMMFVVMQRHGHAEAVHPVCGGSSPPISVDVVTNSI